MNNTTPIPPRQKQVDFRFLKVIFWIQAMLQTTPCKFAFLVLGNIYSPWSRIFQDWFIGQKAEMGSNPRLNWSQTL